MAQWLLSNHRENSKCLYHDFTNTASIDGRCCFNVGKMKNIFALSNDILLFLMRLHMLDHHKTIYKVVV